MKQPAAIADAWRDYRRRVRWFFVVWIGGLVGAAALAYALVSTPYGERVVVVIGIAWLAPNTGLVLVAGAMAIGGVINAREPPTRRAIASLRGHLAKA